MKRFVAICLLVVCVALPLISWGAASYPCPKCGYHNTYTSIGISTINSIYTSHTHGVSIRTDINCFNLNCLERSISYSEGNEPHNMRSKVIDRIPRLNLKQVEHFCTGCNYKYQTYEPIDPSKPHALMK